jgi:hypothetical protein
MATTSSITDENISTIGDPPSYKFFAKTADAFLRAIIRHPYSNVDGINGKSSAEVNTAWTVLCEAYSPSWQAIYDEALEQITFELREVQKRAQCESGEKENPVALASSNLKLATMKDSDLTEISKLIKLSSASKSGLLESISCLIGSVPLTFPEEAPTASVEKIREFFSILQLFSSGAYGDTMSSLDRQKSALFIIKAPNSPNDQSAFDGVHEAYLGFYVFNKMRKLVPNFMYTYAAFECSPPITDKATKKVISWCATKYPEKTGGKDDAKIGKNVMYSVLENLAPTDGSPFMDMSIMAKEQIPDRINSLKKALVACSAYAQIVLATAMAAEQFKYTHYDLHPGNVVLRKTNQFTTPFRIPYRLEGSAQTHYVYTSEYIATVIDYGMTHAVVGDQSVGAVGEDLTEFGVIRSRANPGNDLFKLAAGILRRKGSLAMSGDLNGLISPWVDDTDEYTWAQIYGGIDYDYLIYSKGTIDVDFGAILVNTIRVYDKIVAEIQQDHDPSFTAPNLVISQDAPPIQGSVRLDVPILWAEDFNASLAESMAATPFVIPPITPDMKLLKTATGAVSAMVSLSKLPEAKRPNLSASNLDFDEIRRDAISKNENALRLMENIIANGSRYSKEEFAANAAETFDAIHAMVRQARDVSVLLSIVDTPELRELALELNIFNEKFRNEKEANVKSIIKVLGTRGKNIAYLGHAIDWSNIVVAKVVAAPVTPPSPKKPTAKRTRKSKA